MDLISITPEQGADTLVWLSAAPEALRDSGRYWCKRVPRTPSRTARRDDLAERLWTHTATLAGLDADTLVRQALEAHGGS
jgi:hypothetical protein